VWLRPERPPRDRQLNRERIVRAAVEILDAEGHAGLSMRRAAARLQVTAGSLYWYVAGKDELLELALDEVIGEVRVDLEEPDWRRAIAGMAHDHRAMLRRHAWVLTLLGTQPNMGPNALRLAESGLGILARAGFDDDLLDGALAAVNDHVIGAVVAEAAWRGAARQTDSTIVDWREQAADYLREVRRRHPLLGRRLSAAGAPGIDQVCETRFAFALDCLLDGLEARRKP
jgi:AcrR family transcriptional regulator